MDWTTNHTEVCAFARALARAGAFDDFLAVVRYFESPADWTAEHARWVRLDRDAALMDVVLDTVCLSPEAEEMLRAFDGSPRLDADRRAARAELVEAGLAGLVDEIAVEHYELTEAGRVALEAL